ncbi:hypothetical protein GQ53DRAFT_338204 [Thozetella sp. PMI_491]|nr:hypothetical protein GQ53DRAFT_338204 [Thozetella sp. PMI_491]
MLANDSEFDIGHELFARSSNLPRGPRSEGGGLPVAPPFVPLSPYDPKGLEDSKNRPAGAVGRAVGGEGGERTGIRIRSWKARLPRRQTGFIRSLGPRLTWPMAKKVLSWEQEKKPSGQSRRTLVVNRWKMGRGTLPQRKVRPHLSETPDLSAG